MGVNEYGLEALARARLDELRAAAEAARLVARHARRPRLGERAATWLRWLRRPQRLAPLTDARAAR
jgi:hypothetical protein